MAAIRNAFWLVLVDKEFIVGSTGQVVVEGLYVFKFNELLQSPVFNDVFVERFVCS